MEINAQMIREIVEQVMNILEFNWRLKVSLRFQFLVLGGIRLRGLVGSAHF